MLTDKELVEALGRCATSTSWEGCERCPFDMSGTCISQLMLEASDRIAAGNTMRKADAVEVVRCRDCKWFYLDADEFDDCYNSAGCIYPGPNDYCSHGERKDDSHG